jgi:hypothetical protein
MGGSGVRSEARAAGETARPTSKGLESHGSNIAGDENAIIFGCDSQHLRIEGAIRKHSRGGAKINQRLSAEQSLANVRIYIGVCLKSDLQEASFAVESTRARSKRSAISRGIGYCALIS